MICFVTKKERIIFLKNFLKGNFSISIAKPNMIKLIENVQYSTFQYSMLS